MRVLSVIHQRYQTSLKLCTPHDRISIDSCSFHSWLQNEHHHYIHMVFHRPKQYWRHHIHIQWDRRSVYTYCLELIFFILRFHWLFLFYNLTGWGTMSDERLDGSHGYNYLFQTFFDCLLWASAFVSSSHLSLDLTYMVARLHPVLNCYT